MGGNRPNGDADVNAWREIRGYERRLRRERTIRLWAGRATYTVGYILVTVVAIVLLWVYGA